MQAQSGFETIRNNTALKRRTRNRHSSTRFETIRNNTALKLAVFKHQRSDVLKPFETTQL